MDGAATTSTANLLDRGRQAIQAREWNTAFFLFTEADREKALDPADLLSGAIAAHLTGRDLESAEYLTRAHHGYSREGDPAAAARCGFWLSLWLFFIGDSAQAGGWLSRSRRLLDESRADCVECGYLNSIEGIMTALKGDVEKAHRLFAEAISIARRFADADLLAITLLGQGRTLIRQGEIERGVSLLDEAMIGIMAGEVSPMAAGRIYCAVIEGCSEIYDLRRAQEWTNALERWCAAQPDVDQYRGHCLVRRSEILELNGAWVEALEEADRACEKLSAPPPKAALNAALYRVAELRRLRGEFANAESAYRNAAKISRIPRPGIALLRFDQGDVEAAYATIQPLLAEVHDPRFRPQLLDAFVEIAVSANRIEEARTAAEELQQCASQLDSLLLHAISTRAIGAVRFAKGDVAAALESLRRSLKGWEELKAPYHAARVRALIGRVYDQQGNREAAQLEFDAARAVFEQLGATPDLIRLPGREKDSGPLTAREVEVLKLVASGATNREIAKRLHISEKTVARHLSNIFVKLDLSTRAAATAYAYEHKLV